MGAADEATYTGTLPAGTRLDGIWEIGRKIAAGGMGEVYAGINVHTGDRVAIKVVRADVVETDMALAMFRKEAAALNTLFDEAIVRYYLFSLDPGLQRPYLVMEYVEGRPLKAIVAERRLDFEEIRLLARRVGGGLAVAHDHDIFHRDISPDNILLPGDDPGRAKIIDFGIARQVGGALGTVIGQGFAGKYGYVSPEQIGLFGGEVDGRSDIYSLALVLAEAATGRPRDMRGSALETVEKRQRVPDLSDVDPRLRPILAWMLAPDPVDRPPDLRRVIDALWNLDGPTVVRPAPIAGPPAPPPVAPTADHEPPIRAVDRPPAVVPPAPAIAPHRIEPPEPTRRGGGRAVALSAVATVLFGGLGLGAWWMLRTPADAPPETPVAGAATTLRPGPAPAPTSPPTTPPTAALPPPAAEPITPTPTTPPPTAQTPTAAPSRPPVDAAPTTASPPPTTATPPPVAAAPPIAVPTPLPPSAPPSAAPTPRVGEVVADDAIATLKFARPTPADVARWLAAYAKNNCILLIPERIEAASARTAAFGTSIRPFEVLDGDFLRTFGFAIDIDLHLVMPAHCPLLDRLAGLAGDRPRLDLAAGEATDGATIAGSATAAGRSISVVLVEDDGTVRLLAAGLDRIDFRATVGRRTSGGDKPQLVVALAGAGSGPTGDTRPHPLAAFLGRLEALPAGDRPGAAVRYLVVRR
jgi:serine/threonine-protein kinase